MTSFSSTFICFVFFGIIHGDVTSAQNRQRLLSNTRLPERLLRQTIRLPAVGSQFRSRLSLLPGTRHSWFENPRASSQRLSIGRRGNSGSGQDPLLSNRLHSTGSRAGFESLSRQGRPARPSRLIKLRDRTVTEIPAQPRIYTRNLNVIDGTGAETRRNKNARTNPVKNRSLIATRERLPRTRFRQQQQSVQGEGRQGKGRQGKSRQGKSRQGKSRQDKSRQDKERNSQNNIGRVDNGGGKDLIAIDDVISLVKEIKSNKKPGPDQLQNSALHVSNSSESNSNRSVSSSSIQANEKREPATAGRSAGINSTVRRQESSPLDLLTQMAMMNTDGGMLGSLLSKPSFLSQLSTGNGGIINPIPAEKTKGRGGGERKNKKRKTDVMIHPSLLKGRGKKSGRKMIKTGNPVQDEMISTLLEQTMKNLREDIQESLI